MATRMISAALDLVTGDTPGAQRVAVLRTPGRIELAHARIPEPGHGEIRIKIKWVGICGSDIETFRGARTPEFLSTPTRLGHEVAGTIDCLGDGVTGLAVGSHVSCRYVWGAFAEYIVCRPFNIKVVPETLPLEQVSPLELMPGILHAAELAALDSGKTCLVMGQGVSGLILTQVLRLHSPRRLVVTDLHERNLALALAYGATEIFRIPTAETPTMSVVGQKYPDGFDVVIPCLLEGDGMVDALDCVAFGGRVVMYGCIGPCRRTFDFLKLHRRRADIFSTEPKRNIDMRRFYDEGTQLVLDGLVNTAGIVTHRIPLSRIEEAFALRNNPMSGAIHVLVDCEA